MKEENKKEEIQSRREFFKNAAKKGLPIVAAIALAGMPVISKAESEPMYCQYGCEHSCSGNCLGQCDGTCKFTCSGTCKDGCTDQCSGICRYGCEGGCQRSCMGGCSNSSY